MSKGLLTTSVGSFSKPPYLAKARAEIEARAHARYALELADRLLHRCA